MPPAPPAPDDSPANPAASRPHNCWQLFLAFTAIALQGFGGVLAVIQRELVEKRGWLTNQEFVEDWSVAQIMPGPNVVNMSITLGDRYFGWRGAMSAALGMLLLPMLVVLTLALLYNHWANVPQVAGAVRGMGAVAAGLVAGMGCKLAASLARHPLGPLPCALITAATFIAMSVLRLPLAWVLPVVGGVACALTWRKLPA